MVGVHFPVNLLFYAAFCELARAKEICAKLAAMKPLAVEATKAAARAALSLPLEQGIAYENELSSLCFTGQHLDGIDAFRKRRQP